MHTMFATLISFVLLAQTGGAPGRVVNLVLPRSLNAGEGAVAVVKVGAINRGAQIEIETTSGKLLGVISPYGIRTGTEAGTYTIPVPPEEISNNRISLRIILNYNRSKRAPTTEEVRTVRLKITPAAR